MPATAATTVLTPEVLLALPRSGMDPTPGRRLRVRCWIVTGAMRALRASPPCIPTSAYRAGRTPQPAAGSST